MQSSTAVSAPSAWLLLLEGVRALHEFGAFLTVAPFMKHAKGDGHPVLVLPGLMATDASTRQLRNYLRAQGFSAHGWKLGRNVGLRSGVEEMMIARVKELKARYGGRVSIVGWSLGGLYARELAKKLPNDVRQVITLGSPFAASPKATNAWRIYEGLNKFASKPVKNYSVEQLRKTPPVPTTAIFSRSDGVCAWEGCIETVGRTTENIEVYGSHLGLGHNPSVAYAVADRLAQSEGDWKPFAHSGWASTFYPDPKRH